MKKHYGLWVWYIIPHAFVVLLCYWTNWFACFFPSRQANGRDKLWGIFNLWSTHDNCVDEFFYGKYDSKDTTTQVQYNNSRWVRYRFRVKWLKRNTAYGWTYKLFSIPKGEGFQLKGLADIDFLGFKHNDYNIGWKQHAGIERLSYAFRPVGLRK